MLYYLKRTLILRTSWDDFCFATSASPRAKKGSTRRSTTWTRWTTAIPVIKRSCDSWILNWLFRELKYVYLPTKQPINVSSFKRQHVVENGMWQFGLSPLSNQQYLDKIEDISWMPVVWNCRSKFSHSQSWPNALNF